MSASVSERSLVPEVKPKAEPLSMREALHMEEEELKLEETSPLLEDGAEEAQIAGEDVSATFRYVPILTRDPREFKDKGYRLEIKELQVFIVITMYNEAPEDLTTTLRGVCENLRNFCRKLGDPDFWRKFAVCIVSDGREKANQDTLDYLKDLGVYNESLVSEAVKKYGSSAIGCHLFESVMMFEDNREVGEDFPPLQTVFALKEHNGGKIDSHWWFFKAFCENLMPKYCFLLDVGTKPRRKALFHMYRSMERNPQIAGTCGEITTRQQISGNWLVATQHLEYKMAAMLDKVLESVTGYISVLPGAFSGYRYEAARGTPLSKYFHHVENPEQVTPFEANMYLAEDRLLCFELFTKAGNAYTLHFVADAVAETDVPTTIVDLLKQRRRWLNGTLFATLYEFSEFFHIWTRGDHSWLRKFFVTLVFVYYFVSMLVSFFVVSGFYAIAMIASSYLLPGAENPYAFTFQTLLLLTFLLQFLFGLGAKPKDLSRAYAFLYWVLGFYFLGIFTWVLKISFDVIQHDQRLLAISGLLGYAFFLAVSMVSGMFASVCICLVHYIFATPLFMVMFPIYAICNVHDVSWGTKGVDTGAIPDRNDEKAMREEAERKKKAAAEKEKRETQFSTFRILVASIWCVCNVLFGRITTSFGISDFFIQTAVYGIFLVTVCKFLCLILYKICFFFNRLYERRMNGKVSKTQKSDLRVIAEFLLTPFSPLTWIGIATVFIVAPVMSVVQLAWVASTAVIVIPISFISPLNFITKLFLLSYRFLAKVEFELFSNDGSVAKFLRLDSATKKHTLRQCPQVALENSEGKNLLDNPANWRPIMHFAFAKPIYVVMSLSSVLMVLILSAVFMFADYSEVICDKIDFEDLCKYRAEFYDNAFWDFLRVWYGEYVIGALLFFTFFFIPLTLYSTFRSLVSNLLGMPLVPLNIRKSIHASAEDRSKLSVPKQYSDEVVKKHSADEDEDDEEDDALENPQKSGLQGRALHREEVKILKSHHSASALRTMRSPAVLYARTPGKTPEKFISVPVTSPALRLRTPLKSGPHGSDK